MYRSELPPIGEQEINRRHQLPPNPEYATRGARLAAEKKRVAERKQAAEEMVQDLLIGLSKTFGRDATLHDLGEIGQKIEKRLETMRMVDHEGESIIALGFLIKAIKTVTPPTNVLH